MELGCIIMTLKSKNKLCRILKERRMKLACVIMTIKSRSLDLRKACKEQNEC